MPQEHRHAGLGLTLVLRFAVDELRQRDVERFMAAFNRTRSGDSTPEYNGRVLRAALEAGWVEQPTLTPQAVDDLLPSHVAWFAKQIDALYQQASEIPPE